MTVAPPAVADDPLTQIPDHLEPRQRSQLIQGLMEAKSMSKPEAEDWIASHGERAAEAEIRRRWGAL